MLVLTAQRFIFPASGSGVRKGNRRRISSRRRVTGIEDQGGEYRGSRGERGRELESARPRVGSHSFRQAMDPLLLMATALAFAAFLFLPILPIILLTNSADLLKATYYQADEETTPLLTRIRAGHKNLLCENLASFVGVFFVAQSFGGREVYTREPSAQEERIMVCESPISCAHSGCERACPERS